MMVATLLISLLLQTPVARPPAVGQRPQVLTYDSVVSGLPWDAEKQGPLIAPCPLRVAKGKTLADIDRKLMRVGQVTVVVPPTMVTLNTHFAEAPNLYDGLPRQAKVMYLLTLLTEDQWVKLTNDGMSLSDCRGEQKAVMQSILPNPFRLRSVKVLSPNSWSQDPSTPDLDLSDQDRQQVRLRLVRNVELTLPLNNNGGFTGDSLDGKLKTGMKMRELHEPDGDEYGQHVRIESDNVPKKSQLDTRDPRFDTKVALTNNESIEKLMSRLGSTLNIELYADPHYRNMQLIERGSQATARDLLQAVAYGVCGTYRKVESAYVLTSDLEGVAAHKARLAAWEDDIDKVVDVRKETWRTIVAKSGELGKVKFVAGPHDKLTQKEVTNLEHNDVMDADEVYTTTADASEAVRQAVYNFSGGLALDKEHVGLHSSIRYEFVLPDGTIPKDIGWLDQTNMFTTKPYLWKPPHPGPVPIPFDGPASSFAVVLHADSVQAAKGEITLAARSGVKSVWLETDDPTALKAALTAAATVGIKVSAAIRPWAVRKPNLSDTDVTAAGDHGKTLGSKQGQYLALSEYWQEISAYPLALHDQLAPMSSSVNDRWARIAQLASTPGLAGIELLDAFPLGYAKATSFASGSYFYSPATELFLALGYGETQRLAYLRSAHVDPADIESTLPYTKVSVREVWGDAWSSGNEDDEWQKTRGQWAHDAIAGLLDKIRGAGIPVMLTGQPVKTHIPPYAQAYLYPWKPSADVPTSPEDYIGREAAKLAGAAVVTILDDDEPEGRNRVAANIVKLRSQSKIPVVLDFTSVNSNRLDTAFETWFKRIK
ncbi:MAG: hypothetical protein P4L46_10890 [Fimbriimonas sp.]|nr:hypothetical protein [Fimbriimonas sp.]